MLALDLFPSSIFPILSDLMTLLQVRQVTLVRKAFDPFRCVSLCWHLVWIMASRIWV